MKPYPKIESLFNRDKKTFKFIEGQYRCPEFEYLKDCPWDITEKIHGTNIRVMWDCKTIRFGGRTERSQMPTFLYDKLVELFPVEQFMAAYPDTAMCLYGEGYGARIQKGGGNYIPDGVDFALFDVLVGDWWLRRGDVKDIANILEINTVPYHHPALTITQAIEMVKDGLISVYGDFVAEGLVLRPQVELKARNGKRIIIKIKGEDFGK